MTAPDSPNTLPGDGGVGPKLAKLERFLGSSLLSLFCFIAVLLSLDLPFWLYIAVMVVFVNYTVKIEQIHRDVAALAKATGAAS